jgi:hypothetical protein
MSTSELFTKDFWQRAFTQAVHAAAASALTPLATQQLGELNSVPWYAIVSAAVIGGVASVLFSLATVKVPGTMPASLVPSKLVDTTPGE